MKKNEVKKLQLSRETLLELEGPQARKAMGGGGSFSNPSYCATTVPVGSQAACCVAG